MLEIFIATWQGAAESLGLQVLLLGRSCIVGAGTLVNCALAWTGLRFDDWRDRSAYAEQLFPERLHRFLPVARTRFAASM